MMAQREQIARSARMHAKHTHTQGRVGLQPRIAEPRMQPEESTAYVLQETPSPLVN